MVLPVAQTSVEPVPAMKNPPALALVTSLCSALPVQRNTPVAEPIQVVLPVPQTLVKSSREPVETLDQREPWGSLQAEFEFSGFIPDLSLYRIDLEADVNVRLARGLSLSIEGNPVVVPVTHQALWNLVKDGIRMLDKWPLKSE